MRRNAKLCRHSLVPIKDLLDARSFLVRAYGILRYQVFLALRTVVLDLLYAFEVSLVED